MEGRKEGSKEGWKGDNILDGIQINFAKNC